MFKDDTRVIEGDGGEVELRRGTWSRGEYNQNPPHNILNELIEYSIFK